ncbi:MAG: hypothetical protein US89_C0007G0032 [Candidatus Peregrinibacteria bacterium GW2011_GWF2_38_29]|nr:MAG: hypothetical protein US89_C0007G0032 [Candidatus Peregrinibacteria bacterium GW2011_GWF2_38_29]HBB02849.1 hypothetical protein [Candidatus Peregrinibacteria bacterium]
MITKLILEPEDMIELVPHWPELDADKLARIARRGLNHVKIHNRFTGGHISADVLNVPPITVCDSNLHPGRGYIINGKNRATIALLIRAPLVAINVETRNDIEHCLPRECFGDITTQGTLESFENRLVYERRCQAEGVSTMSDLLIANVGTILKVLSADFINRGRVMRRV